MSRVITILRTLQDNRPHGHSHIVGIIRNYVGIAGMQRFRQTCKVLHTNIRAFSDRRRVNHKIALELDKRNMLLRRRVSWCDSYETLHSCLEKVTDLTFFSFKNKTEDYTIDISLIPRYLTKLSFGIECFQTINIIDLPRSLQTLRLGSIIDKKTVLDFSTLTRLENLCLGVCKATILWHTLPTSLKRLDMLFTNATIDFASLPNLEYLNLGYGFNKPFRNAELPRTLKYLNYGSIYEEPIDLTGLPTNLLSLKLSKCTSQHINTRQLPRSLQVLELGDAFNHPIDLSRLPSELRYLTLGNSFNQPINAKDLPRKLTYLYVGCAFNRRLSLKKLPETLRNLAISSTFYQDYDISELNKKCKVTIISGI
jgi:hypothetical protein